MPQADQVLTVSFETPATGIFREISSERHDIVESVHIRLDQVVELLFLLKNSDQVPLHVQNALGAVEAMIEDTAAMLAVVAAR